MSQFTILGQNGNLTNWYYILYQLALTLLHNKIATSKCGWTLIDIEYVNGNVQKEKV